MHIAYLVSQYPAASHTFVRREIAALRARGIAIDTFSIREPSPAERVLGSDKAEFEQTFYVLPPKLKQLARAHSAAVAKRPLRYLRTLGLALTHRVSGVKAFVWALAHFAEAIVVAEEMEKRQIEHVHNHFANSGANVGFLVTRHLGATWSLTLHGVSETDYPAGPLLPAKLAAADFAVVISYYQMGQAMRVVSPDHWSKLVLMHCGLDLSVLPAPSQVPRRRPRIVSVARFAPEKGVLGMVEAFAMMRARGLDAELVLVGDGPDRARVQARVAELGLNDSVRLTGGLPERDTLAVIASADVFALASFMEGVPVVLMEAMALGIPVVAPRVAGIPELVEDGVHGFLFPTAAWHELAECLHKLLSDPALRARLSQTSRAKVEAEFEVNSAVAPLYERFARAKAPAENPSALLRRAFSGGAAWLR